MDILTQHQEKALNYSTHISLTANAGSGKTLVLAKRFIQIALKENISLRNIAAITFTDKAAGELYKKIALEIDANLRKCCNKSDKEKLESIRSQLVSANISTIHSFCINILREFPTEAKLDANFIPIDSRVSNELIELSIDELFTNLLEDNSKAENLKYLMRVFSTKTNLSRQITNIIGDRKNLISIKENIYLKNENEIAEYFYATFIEYSKKIIGDIRTISDCIRKINNIVLSAEKDNIIANQVDAILNKLVSQESFLEQLNSVLTINKITTTKKGDILKRNYLSSKLREGKENDINSVEEIFKDINLIPIIDNHKTIEKELAKFGKIFIYIADEAVNLYSKKKKENGYIDFEDILLLTQNIISIPSVKNSLSEKFQYLLIDEYQDTNELQYKIFLPILDDLMKGNLFIVGDDKQSIYMFRDAELEVFNLTKKNIESVDGISSILTLPDSFRMAPELCLFTNSLFRKLFANPNPLYNEVHHSDLVCATEENINGHVEFLIDVNNSENALPTGSPSESEMVARKIIQLVQNKNESLKYTWNDIAILCRKRKSFKELELTFIKYNIPFQIIGGKDFYERQIIFDIYNYFSFLLDENNDSSLIGVLRSPFCFFSDSEIFQISNLPGKNFYRKLILYSENNIVIKKKISLLVEIKSIYIKSNFVFLLRKILTDSTYLSVIASQTDGAQELSNIQKLIQLSISYFSQGFRTLYDYVNYLKDAIENSYDESQASVIEDSNCVKLMTLHQAKGLEFPIVFLFKSNDNTREESVKSKSILVDKNFGILTKLPLYENYFDDYIAAPIIGVCDLINNKKNIAEIKRLFYVGVTRAKNILFITATVGEKMKINKESFIDLLIHGLNINLKENNFTMNSQLTFLKREDQYYSNYTKNVNVEIPITKDFDATVNYNNYQLKSFNDKKIFINNHEEKAAGKIISATKFAQYSQCPVKYELSELGLDSILDLSKLNKQISSPVNKNGINDYNNHADISKVKGNIIHKILEYNYENEKFEELWTQASSIYINNSQIKTVDYENLKSDIKRLLSELDNSQFYKKLKYFSNYKTEYEIFAKEGDFYLFGIIDKIVFESDKIIIVDYKTNSIQKNGKIKKSDLYINQMKFYAYIVSKLFPEISNFSLFLLYLEDPKDPVTLSLNKDNLNDIKVKINDMIIDIKNQTYNKNLNHCDNCKYAIDYKKCFKK